MTEWITDRQPAEADGDKDEAVLMSRFHDGRSCSPSFSAASVDWRHVGPGVPWRHTSIWSPPAEPEPEPEPATTAANPRRFVSVRRTILRDGDHILDAIDDQGTAWWMRIDTSPHHPAFPASEHEWHRLTPLPPRQEPAQ